MISYINGTCAHHTLLWVLYWNMCVITSTKWDNIKCYTLINDLRSYKPSFLFMNAFIITSVILKQLKMQSWKAWHLHLLQCPLANYMCLERNEEARKKSLTLKSTGRTILNLYKWHYRQNCRYQFPIQMGNHAWLSSSFLSHGDCRTEYQKKYSNTHRII